MSREHRWATMGLDAWDEWTPEEVRDINKRRDPRDPYIPSRIPGVRVVKGPLGAP
jgi:hypothetical protein